MSQVQRLDFGDGRTSPMVGVEHVDELGASLGYLGLPNPTPVLALVGGASNLDPEVVGRLRELLDSLCPWLDRFGVTAVDGGTAYGVMALFGAARRDTGARFPLLGVAALGTVSMPMTAGDGAALDPNHSHFLLVPGTRWGDESGWISDAARVLAGGMPTLTLVLAGGAITRLDVINHLQARHRLVTIAGSGGTADALARWVREGDPVPGMQLTPKQRDQIRVLDLDDASAQLPDLLFQAFGS